MTRHVVSAVVSSSLTLGDGDTASVYAGGTAVNMTVGYGADATVYGGGSVLNTSVTYSGSMEVSAGGTASGTTLTDSATLLVAAGAVANATTVSYGGTMIVSGATASGVTDDYGALQVQAGGVVSSATLGFGATERVAAGGSAIGGVIERGATETVSSGGLAENVVVSSAGVLDLQSGALTSGTITFAGTSATVQISGTVMPAATIDGLGAGETIALPDIPVVAGGTATLGPGNVLSITEGADTFTLHLDPQAQYGSSFSLATSGGGVTLTAIEPACFLEGTLIATPAGEVAVESLRAGQLVSTAGGGALAVRWLGVSTVATRFADPLRALPVRIRAGALAAQVPARDLLVSPGHAVLVEDVLIHAAALVNGCSIVRETQMPASFRYYHIELDTHALLLAEGAAAESFLESEQERGFDNAVDRIPPAAAEELPYPRARASRQVPRASREWLAARAAALYGPRSAVA